MFLGHISEDGLREQPLAEHLKNTAELAGEFAESFHCRDWGYACGLLHDIGKYSRQFQERIRGSAKRVDHSTAGAIVTAENRRLYSAAYCIAGHHAGLPDGGSTADGDENPSLCGRLKRRVPDCSSFKEEISVPEVRPPQLKPSGKGLFSVTFFIRMLFSCLVDADYLDTERFMRNTARGHICDSMETLWERLQEYITPWLEERETDPINRHRTEILRNCIENGSREQGIYNLTVPTGGGKTISSMAFALRHAVEHDLKRVIYVIPYTSIIEQNAKVFRDILGENNVLENHSNAVYADSEELRPVQLASENWDMPVVVTTNVQFFESLFASKSSKCRKLHNIAKSVLIFDEAQMLPEDYLLPCLRGISELVLNYGCTAVLCTATQPSLQPLFPGQMMKGELCLNVKELYDVFRRVSLVREHDLTAGELAERLASRSRCSVF